MSLELSDLELAAKFESKIVESRVPVDKIRADLIDMYEWHEANIV